MTDAPQWKEVGRDRLTVGFTPTKYPSPANDVTIPLSLLAQVQEDEWPKVRLSMFAAIFQLLDSCKTYDEFKAEINKWYQHNGKNSAREDLKR